MLVVHITPPQLENDEVHERTIVQVDEDSTFDSPMIDDDSEENLNRRQYSESLSPGNKYYVRARYYLEPGGYQGWSNVYSFTATDVNEVDIRVEPPIMAIPPRLTMLHYDKYSCPQKDFRIALGIHDLNINKVQSITTLIERLDGTVVYKSMNNTTNLNFVTIEKHLDINTSYIVRVSTTTKSGSVSSFGSLLIKTFNISKDFSVIRDTLGYNTYGIPAEFKLRTAIDYESYELDIINYKYEIIYSESIDSTEVDVSDEVTEDTLYVRIRGKINDEFTDWIYLINISPLKVGFPYALPVQLG